MRRSDDIFSFMIIFSISIAFVSSDTGNPSGGGEHQGSGNGNPNDHYSGGSSGGELTVVISYEAHNNPSINFFNNQLTSELFNELSQCNIDWKIYPCSTSKMVMEKLTCVNLEPECAADRIYACATKLNEGKMKLVGKFVICQMKDGSQQSSASKCATQAGLDWGKIESCSKTTQADKDCHEYWGKANDDWQMNQLPGVMVPPKYVESDGIAAKQDFKGFVCKKLKEKNISCPVCGGSSGTGGSGGGEHNSTDTVDDNPPPGGNGGTPSGGIPGGNGGSPSDSNPPGSPP